VVSSFGFFIADLHRMRERNVALLNRGSLLGISKPSQYSSFATQTASEELLERQNERKIEELTKSVKNIKKISEDIESGIQESNQLLDTLDNELFSVQGILKATTKKLDQISKQSGSRHMCYLFLFVIFVFVLLYFMIRAK